MKDWKIMRNGTERELAHRCKKIRLHCSDDIWCGKITTRGPDGRWICLDCGVYAPEEIGFCAELAHCREVDQDNTILTGWLEINEK